MRSASKTSIVLICSDAVHSTFRNIDPNTWSTFDVVPIEHFKTFVKLKWLILIVVALIISIVFEFSFELCCKVK